MGVGEEREETGESGQRTRARRAPAKYKTRSILYSRGIQTIQNESLVPFRLAVCPWPRRHLTAATMHLVNPILLALLSASQAVSLQIPLPQQAATAPPARVQSDESPTSPSSGRSQASPRPPAADPGRLLTLRHAVHLPLHERHRPASRRDYDSAEVLSLSAADPALYPLSQAVKTRRVRAQRPNSQAAFQAARRHAYRTKSIPVGRIPTRQDGDDARLAEALEWEDMEIDAPDVTSVETLAAFGKMTSNAYSLPEDGTWYDVGGGWNAVRLPLGARSSCPIAQSRRVLTRLLQPDRPTRLGGKRTGCAATFSPTRRTRLWSSPSREPAHSWSVEVGGQATTTRSTCVDLRNSGFTLDSPSPILTPPLPFRGLRRTTSSSRAAAHA